MGPGHIEEGRQNIRLVSRESKGLDHEGHGEVFGFYHKCKKSLMALSRGVPGSDLFFEVLLAVLGIGNQREKMEKRETT